MCGIVGYIGNQKATPILLNGLSALEYRGYDSAGIAVLEKNNICRLIDTVRYCASTEADSSTRLKSRVFSAS